MPFASVEKPVPVREAFSKQEESAMLSQAAALLLIGSQLRGDAESWQQKFAPERGRMDFLVEDDTRMLAVPRVDRAPGTVNSQRVREILSARYKTTFVASVLGSPNAVPLSTDILSDLGERFFLNSNPGTATDLIEACLLHPIEVVRVAAAISHHERSPEPERLIAILADGARSSDELVRDLAATGLARMDPANSRLMELQARRGGFAAGAPSHTSLLVHGTWARTSSWWQLGGDFHSYILESVWTDLYAAADRYEWSGGYSDPARSDAAAELLQWVDERTLEGLNLMTHSHGGSVAMLASQNGLKIGEMVLLSCPVHAEYQPNFGNIAGKVVSIRVHMDLVLLADRSGQRFNDPRIQEHVLPMWFDHAATHDPNNWPKYGVPGML